ncbi:MAG: class I SAM-dependent methyltransferase [Rhodospirillaceae bacterium]|nr:class I SAM-dependent methyltransferase [Rhodospirillaceae bacterium]
MSATTPAPAATTTVSATVPPAGAVNLGVVSKTVPHDPKSSYASALIGAVDRCLTAALLEPNIDSAKGFYAIDGMSGKKYRHFINALIRSLDDARYLEVGSWAGSTLCSAIHHNAVRAVAIDNWSEFGGPKDVFQAHLKLFATPAAKVTFIESDFRTVNYRDIGAFNVYLFDGPHEAKDQYDGLALALPALDNQFVFIVDDWNWERVRAGTTSAIKKCGLQVLYAAEIKTTADNTHPLFAGKHSDWHNGYFISVLAKP